MNEENTIKAIFGGYVTIVIVAAQATGVDGAIVLGGLGLLGGIISGKVFNKVAGRK